MQKQANIYLQNHAIAAGMFSSVQVQGGSPEGNTSRAALCSTQKCPCVMLTSPGAVLVPPQLANKHCTVDARLRLGAVHQPWDSERFEGIAETATSQQFRVDRSVRGTKEDKARSSGASQRHQVGRTSDCVIV